MAVDMYPVRLGDFIWNGNEYVSINNDIVDRKCNAPFICCSIAWNGDVDLCCNHGETVENMSDRSFQEVWRGENYQRLRRQVNDDNEMPVRCRNCFWVNRY